MMDAKQLTQIWLNMAKAEESKQVTSTQQHFAKPAIIS
jgi:hypothetical protein